MLKNRIKGPMYLWINYGSSLLSFWMQGNCILQLSMPVDFQFLLQSGLHTFFVAVVVAVLQIIFPLFSLHFYILLLLLSYFICPTKEIIR